MDIMLKRIKDLREDNNYTQTKVANELNIAQNSYSQIEKGVNNMQIEYIIKLAYFYNTSADYLLGITNEMTPYKRIKQKNNIQGDKK